MMIPQYSTVQYSTVLYVLWTLKRHTWCDADKILMTLQETSERNTHVLSFRVLSCTSIAPVPTRAVKIAKKCHLRRVATRERETVNRVALSRETKTHKIHFSTDRSPARNPPPPLSLSTTLDTHGRHARENGVNL